MSPDEVLAELTAGVVSSLADHLVGVYAVGLAPHDAAFLVVSEVTPSPAAQERLRLLHRGLREPPSGSYAALGDLRSPMTLGRRWLRAAPGSRELALSDEDNTAHGRWVLREHGVALTGPPSRTLVAPISAAMLRAEALGSARARAELQEDDLAAYDDPSVQRDRVLTSCRIFHTAVEGRVTGRLAAATWAIEHVPDVHRALVRAAIADRLHPRLARPTRAFVWEVVNLAGTAALAARDP